MSETPLITCPSTPRLLLRAWCEADREPFGVLNGDAETMRFFATPITREASDASIDAWQAQLGERGWSNWAVERRDTGAFIGFVGLTVPKRVLPFSPCVEIGWRLMRAHWGQGFATEAARAVLRVGFEEIGLAEIVSFTTLLNLPSRAVMARIGLIDAQQNFEHPGVPEGHAFGMHCLYRLRSEEWHAAQPTPAA